MGKFVLRKKTDFSNLELGSELESSDFSHFTEIDGKETFLQWEYLEDKLDNRVTLKPGCWKVDVKNGEMFYTEANFTKNPKLLEEYVHTKHLTEKIDNFFNKLDVYKKYDIFPKRGILLHGPQGTGKSQIISKASEHYLTMNDVAIIIWQTDKFRSRDVNHLLQNTHYDDVKRLIFVIEDIGGVSIKNEGTPMPVEPSLLNMLDNTQGTFKIPTLIIATTNFPENLLQNLSNRPQRFDYLYKVGNPDEIYRSKFLEFFSLGKATEGELRKIQNKKYDNFSVAHIKEIVIRSELHDITISESMDELLKQSELSKNDFSDPKRSAGISFKGLDFDEE